MPESVFAKPEDVYETLGAFMKEIVNHPEIGPKFTASNTSFHIVYTEPAGCEMTVDCTGPTTLVTCGPGGDPAEINLVMSAADGHLFWLGRLNMTLALARQQVKVSGTMSKMMKLLPALRPCFPLYKEFLETHGRADLAAAK
jgi:hypothetical protein